MNEIARRRMDLRSMDRERPRTATDANVNGFRLAAPLPTPGRIGSHGAAPVQRYRKQGDLRISDGNQLAVLDDGLHNRAYAAVAEIEATRAHRDAIGSQIELSAGAPAAIDGLAAGCREVRVRQRPSDEANRQRSGSLARASRYRAAARAEMASLRSRSLWQVLTCARGPDVHRLAETIRVEDDMLEQPVRDVLELIYEAIAVSGGRDFSPANVRRVAEAKGLEKKFIYRLMQRTDEYHDRIMTECHGADGMTTPNDCGSTANDFVIGGECRMVSMPEDTGYRYHAFSMLLRDDTDRIALENAVGRNVFEQLYKQAPFDAGWHWQMRGTQRPDDEAGKAHAELRGVGEPYALPENTTPADRRAAYLQSLDDVA